MLEFEGEPGFLERYSVTSFDANQTLGKIGVLTLDLHPRGFRTEVEFDTHLGLQEMLGEEIECSIGDWRFKGVVVKVETNTQEQIFRLTVHDALSKLAMQFGSRVFVEQTVDDIVSELMPSEQSHECLGDVASAQLRCAIQYQESNLQFLRRLCNLVGAQVWCAGDTIYVGSSPTSASHTLRLGRDIAGFTVETRLGPESVAVDSIPYASDNSVEQTSHNLASRQYGRVQDDAISRRESHQVESRFHVTHEDSSFEDTGQAAQQFLRARAAGRFTLTGTAHTPVTLGAACSVENWDRAAEEVANTEETVITEIRLFGERPMDAHLWTIRVENPESLLSGGDPVVDRIITSSAIVNDVDDPLNANRIKVYFPWDPNESSTPWLRVTTPYWGDDHAHYLPPKIGDTVLVTWGQRDMDPIVVGSVMAGQELDLTDQTFVLKTVEGQTITIGEDNIKLTNGAQGGGAELEILSDTLVLRTPNNQTVTIGSDSLTLENGSSSITIESAKITINAATVEVTNTGGAKVALSGPTVNVNNGALEVT